VSYTENTKETLFAFYYCDCGSENFGDFDVDFADEKGKIV
jgi:hypothetical protein